MWITVVIVILTVIPGQTLMKRNVLIDFAIYADVTTVTTTVTRMLQTAVRSMILMRTSDTADVVIAHVWRSEQMN